MKKILINTNLGGGLGNHFLNYIWMLEISRRTGCLIINPALRKYTSWFDSLPHNFIVCASPRSAQKIEWHLYLMLLPFISSFWLFLLGHIKIIYTFRLLSKLANLYPIKYFIGYICFDWLVSNKSSMVQALPPTFMFSDGSPDMLGSGVMDLIRKHPLTLLDSAAILPEYSQVHPDTLDLARLYFTPKLRFVSGPQALKTSAAKSNTHLIGVQIRQGDFKSWRGGSWYIEPETFADILFQLVNELHQEYLLILCSDEVLDRELFSSFNTFYPDPSAPQQLGYLMHCDYMLGTDNSTFGQMASFLGQVPIHCVNQSNKQQRISLSNFQASKVPKTCAG